MCIFITAVNIIKLTNVTVEDIIIKLIKAEASIIKFFKAIIIKLVTFVIIVEYIMAVIKAEAFIIKSFKVVIIKLVTFVITTEALPKKAMVVIIAYALPTKVTFAVIMVNCLFEKLA